MQAVPSAQNSELYSMAGRFASCQLRCRELLSPETQESQHLPLWKHVQRFIMLSLSIGIDHCYVIDSEPELEDHGFRAIFTVEGS